jgi:DNA-binding SARP family transcriptional activator
LHDGVEVPFGQRGSVAFAVAIYIWVEGHGSVHRDELLKVFKPKGRGEFDVRQIRYQLRKLFGHEAISSPDDGLQFEVPVDVDAVRLEGLTPAEPPDDTLSALYQDHFLSGFDGPKIPPAFVAWAAQRREQLSTRALALLNDSAESAWHSKELGRVLLIGRRIAELFPERDEGHLWVLRVLEERGEYLAAIAHYETAVRHGRDRGSEIGDVVSATADRIGAAYDAVLRNRANDEPVPSPATDGVQTTPPGERPPGGPALTRRRGGSRARAWIAGVVAICLAGLILWRREAGVIPVCSNGDGRASLIHEIYWKGSGVNAGGEFTKGWSLKNEGTCAWTPQFKFAFVPSPGAAASRFRTDTSTIYLVRRVPPGDSITIRVKMIAPDVHENIVERWALLDPTGAAVSVDQARYLLADIIVRKPPIPVCAPHEVLGELVATSKTENQPIGIGEPFSGDWTIHNRQLCEWSAAVGLRRVSPSPGPLSGDSGYVVAGEPVLPGDRFTFQVPMHTPKTAGPYREDWGLVAQDGSPRTINDGRSAPIRIVAVEPGRGAPTLPAVCEPGEGLAGFLSERVRDGLPLPPDTLFHRTWTLYNGGPCRWEAPMELQFDRIYKGMRMSTVDRVSLEGQVLPRGTYSFTVPMRTPTVAGTHGEVWKLVDRTGKAVRLPNRDEVWMWVEVDTAHARQRPF